ncbi:MAG: hypothetical protein HDR00_09225 [Lachnospiraceae bacterium]|nr:hypothetical protein [Lachnospiraceae bacterium]
MEFAIIYFWVLILTTIIGLNNSDKAKKVRISLFIKICLLLFPSKGEVPIYFLIIRAFVQLLTIVCFIIVIGNYNINSQELQKIYGFIMIGIVIPITILMEIIYRKK